MKRSTTVICTPALPAQQPDFFLPKAAPKNISNKSTEPMNTTTTSHSSASVSQTRAANPTRSRNFLKPFARCAVFAFALIAFVGGAFAQTATDGDYRSVATGNWSDTTKWQVRASSSWATAGSAPTSANNVYIQSGHTMTANSATVACKDLHVHTGGVLAIGANTVQVNGKIRAYTGTAVTTAGADGTFYSGADSSG